MDTAFFFIGISNIVSGVLVIAVCMPLLGNKISMNRVYGFRFKKSFESEENWIKINRYGARRMIMWSLVVIAMGLYSLTLSADDGKTLRVILAGAQLLLLIPAVESWKFAKRL